VHAGIRPDRPWAEQDEEDLFWIREEFIVPPHRLSQTIVFGHTPQRHVYVQLPYKIGIDTGCVYGGMLTCIELAEGVLHQVRLGERRVRQSALVSSPRAGAPRSP
jgi:serine/threonine protein phosphatase 1